MEELGGAEAMILLEFLCPDLRDGSGEDSYASNDCAKGVELEVGDGGHADAGEKDAEAELGAGAVRAVVEGDVHDNGDGNSGELGQLIYRDLRWGMRMEGDALVQWSSNSSKREEKRERTELKLRGARNAKKRVHHGCLQDQGRSRRGEACPRARLSAATARPFRSAN